MIKDVVYDLETYRNCFTFTIVLVNNPSRIRTYEISDRKDDTEEILLCLRNLRKGNYRMIGYNNLGFDYPIIHEIMIKSAEAKQKNKPLKLTAKYLNSLAQKQIDATKEGGFPKIIKDFSSTNTSLVVNIHELVTFS